LVHPAQGDRRLAEALADQVKTAVHSHGLVRPNVVLVDHGSPQAAVAEVRDYLAGQLREVLGTAVQRVVAASMERREGDAYDFNDPLLARVLRMAPYDAGDLVVALQFLSPGRHAGPGGDIETICKEAQSERPQLRTYMTQPIGTDPRVLQLLVERLGQGLSP
jgi:sirohydrochlorin ferrochelatase